MNLRRKIVNKELVVGTWTQTGDPTVAEIMAECGYDFIAADIEHTHMTEADFVTFARAVKGKTAAFARVENKDEMAIRRMLDLGAEGIIVPMINNAEEANAIVSAAKYAPMGKRGFAFVRANKYGVDFDTYAKNANDQITLIAMIETKEAVENIDEILSVDGIDGVFIGPYDLSGSYGVPGQVTHPLVTEAKEKVLKSCVCHNKVAGQHIVYATKENVAEAVSLGYTFFAFGTDIVFLDIEARKTAKLIDEMK